LLEIWNLQYSKKICEINKEKPKFKNPKALLGRLPNASARPNTHAACSSSCPCACLPSGARQTGRARALATGRSRGELQRAIAHRRWLLWLRQAPPPCYPTPSAPWHATFPYSTSLEPTRHPPRWTVALGGEAPATARPHCPVRAWNELHQTTVELAKKKRRDERLPNYPDHSGFGLQQGLARGDRGGSKNVASPTAQRSTQKEG
jgi:hypothetical protein